MSVHHTSQLDYPELGHDVKDTHPEDRFGPRIEKKLGNPFIAHPL